MTGPIMTTGPAPDIHFDAWGETHRRRRIRTGERGTTISIVRPRRRRIRPVIGRVGVLDDYDDEYPAYGNVTYNYGPTFGPNYGLGRMRFGEMGPRHRRRGFDMADMMDMMGIWMDNADDEYEDYDDEYDDDYDSDDGYGYGIGGGGRRRYDRVNPGMNMHRLGGGAPRATRMLDWRPQGAAGLGRQRQGARDFVMY